MKLLTFLLVFLLFACGQEAKTTPEGSSEATHEDQTASPESNALAVVERWNNCHHPESTAGFATLFDESVIYYKTKLSGQKCLEKKTAFLQKHPDFTQRIIGEIQLDTLSAEEIKCSFVKETRLENKTTRYSAYLHLKKRGNEWKITIEGDETTDMNLQKKPGSPETDASRIRGDFDGDGTTESMWLEQPKFPPGDEDENFGECLGDCICMIRFSNPKMPAIELGSCIGGLPINKGDLNGDGSDEIGILPDWWTSCWRNYYVYTFNPKSKTWEYLLNPITTHCIQWENDFGFIQKHPSKKGYVIIEYSIWEDDDIRVRKKTVKLP